VRSGSLKCFTLWANLALALSASRMSGNNATNMHSWHCWPDHHGLSCVLTTKKLAPCSASSERKVATHIVPRASWQLGQWSRVFLDSSTSLRCVLVDTMNQADVLDLQEESPSLWPHFYRIDVNVFATGRLCPGFEGKSLRWLSYMAWTQPRDDCHLLPSTTVCEVFRTLTNFRHAL
jgi:hypothetical protein